MVKENFYLIQEVKKNNKQKQNAKLISREKKIN